MSQTRTGIRITYPAMASKLRPLLSRGQPLASVVPRDDRRPRAESAHPQGICHALERLYVFRGPSPKSAISTMPPAKRRPGRKQELRQPAEFGGCRANASTDAQPMRTKRSPPQPFPRSADHQCYGAYYRR